MIKRLYEGSDWGIGTITDDYFSAFNNRNLNKLHDLYADDVVLEEWGENIYVGKDKVLDANADLFEKVGKLKLVVLKSSIYLYSSLNQIKVYIDDAPPIDVVDVISCDDLHDCKIFRIKAYRGF